jgi:hypothetical protein
VSWAPDGSWIPPWWKAGRRYFLRIGQLDMWGSLEFITATDLVFRNVVSSASQSGSLPALSVEWGDTQAEVIVSRAANFIAVCIPCGWTPPSDWKPPEERR